MLFVNKDPFKNIFGNAFNFELEGWSLNKFTLSFSGPAKKYESLFLDTYFKNSIKPFRLSVLLGIFIYAVFYLLDTTLFPDLEKKFFIIRFGFVIPIMIGILIFSYIPDFRKYMQIVASFGMYITSFGVILMIVMTASHAGNYSYYAGLILILFFGYTITRIRFIYAFVTGWLVVLTYEAASFMFTDTPAKILYNNNFFFLTSNLVGMFMSYYLEYTERRNFFLQLNLKKERQKVFEVNELLEHKVQERTRDLTETNKKLKQEIERRDLYKKEKSQLEAQLFQLQKMETIGTLAGGIAHDFNNILTPITGYSGMLLDELPDEEPMKDDIEQIHIAAKKGKELVQKVLAFSRQMDTEMKPVKLNDIIPEAIGLTKVSLPDNIVIKTDLPEDTSLILADKPQILQVVMNLIINAIHAMKNKGGRLEIRLNSEQVKDKWAGMERKVKDEKFVVLTVADTGTGMSNETLNRIFEPFYTNKEVGEGTGLGLSIVHGIVSNHKGFIEVVSKLNVGTIFKVYFPEYKGVS